MYANFWKIGSILIIFFPFFGEEDDRFEMRERFLIEFLKVRKMFKEDLIYQLVGQKFGWDSFLKRRFEIMENFLIEFKIDEKC